MEFNSTDWSKLNFSFITNGGFNENAYIHFTIAASFALGLCLIGIVGNITVFWYLFFRIQKNKYTVYIINLAAADCMFLIFLALVIMLQLNTLVGADPYFVGKGSLNLFIEIFYDTSMYSGMFFLTAISIERCLAVLFPIWYQCSRPKSQSPIVCFCLWIIGSLESLIENLACTLEDLHAQTKQCTGIQIMIFFIGICICLPLMITSSLILLIRIRRTLRQHYSSRLYIVIIAAVCLFIISVFPFNLVWLLYYFKLLNFDINFISIFYINMFHSILNTTCNPYIYVIVGRKNKLKSKISIQEILQRAFSVEDENNEKMASNEANTQSSQTNTGKML